MILHTFVISLRSLDMPYDLFLYNKTSVQNSFVQCTIVFCVTCDLICGLWPVACDLWPDLWPVTCDLWPVTCTLAPPLYIPCIWFNLLPVYPFPKDTFGSKQRQGVGEGYIKRYMYLFPNLLRETGQLTSLLYETKYNIIHFVKHQNYNMYRIITNDFGTEAIFFFHM